MVWKDPLPTGQRCCCGVRPNLCWRLDQEAQQQNHHRSRGRIWSAQASPKKTNVKDSADLKESRMSLEDRLAFIEGKKAEVASIFEIQVWEIELRPEKVDWNRVMKARFVLKWSADNNGNPRHVRKHVRFFKGSLTQTFFEENSTPHLQP